jgi:hypothetical protein
MNININHLTKQELQKTAEQLKEQINWNMEHKIFGLVIALQAGLVVIEADLSKRV